MHFEFEEYTISPLDTNRPDSFFELIQDNRNRLEDFFAGTVKQTQTPQATEQYFRDIVEKIEDRSYFAFVAKNTQDDRYVGFVDVKNIDWDVRKAELGYFVDKNYEGLGLTTRIVGHVVQHITETYGFKKLLCRIGVNNTGSARVSIKNGFILEGTIRRDYVTTSGKIVDLNYYGRIID